jgi:hypothetical protein
MCPSKVFRHRAENRTEREEIMSSDNGYVLRQDSQGKYVLQMYYASADSFPEVNGNRAMRFDTLEEAIFRYQELEQNSDYPSEYGLSVQLKREKPMIETTKYARKPFYVDAVRVTQNNIEDVAAWAQGEVRRDTDTGREIPYIHVRVFRPLDDRQTKAFIGDWVLYAGTGYKVYTNRAFLNSFDKVEGAEKEQPADTEFEEAPAE